ncbi:arsenate reductase ArsC [Granulicoccus phenolivorans]|uniref:arsenate reductase ArsC n=1 Tax=Granulicoccus phenolivorans TaxID=266854 RepID=UPI000410559F|nr:arsenate reductase ArsC [Granulicoccus phenolivorans]
MTTPTAPDQPHPAHPALTLDAQQALHASAQRLAKQFEGMYSLEIIENYLKTSYAALAARARVTNHLPILAETLARHRLRATARAEGMIQDGLPTVLFLCIHNAGRSQMALGFFRHYAAGRALGWSAGSEPAAEVNPVAVRAMAERGIDISEEFPKPLSQESVRAAQVVITMGCGDACPILPGTRYVDWELDDPAGQDIEAVRPIRDEIDRRVQALLAELGVPAKA